MKKVLTILVVLALVCGAVFAAETHRVTLKTIVAEVVPTFQLSNTSLTAYKDVDGVKTAVANVQQYTNINEVEFTDGESYTPAAENRDEVAVGDLSKYDVEVTFTVYLANKAKTMTDYKLSFTAGDFAVIRNETEGTLSATAVETPFGELGAKVGTDGNTSVTTAVSNGVVSVDFNGNECKADTILATYTTSYKHDPSINPTDDNGYVATITMLVEVAN